MEMDLKKFIYFILDDFDNAMYLYSRYYIYCMQYFYKIIKDKKFPVSLKQCDNAVFRAKKNFKLVFEIRIQTVQKSMTYHTSLNSELKALPIKI